MRRSTVSILALTSCLTACGSNRSSAETAPASSSQAAADSATPDEPADKSGPAITPDPGGPGTITGFAAPESAIHDPVADVYLVSNVAGAPDARDHDGFISKVAPDGEILAREWITGESPTTDRLSAPKGMAIVGDRLAVADIDELRVFERETGEPVLTISTGRWKFLNDVAPDGAGGFLVTDTVGGGVYQVGESGEGEPVSHGVSFDRPSPGEPEGTRMIVRAVDTSPALAGPNGVAVRQGTILVASWDGGELLELRADAPPAAIARPDGPAGQLDGIAVLADGRVLVSSWARQAVLAVSPAGEWSEIVGGLESPADIGFDATRERVLIPQMMKDQVVVHPL